MTIDKYQEIEISEADFLPLLKWCLLKFEFDPSSRRSFGGRDDKIGGFIDRFANQCVNWIIFNHLLADKDFEVDPDFFFYNEKSAKKCADVIGLKGNSGKIVPLSYFVKDEWIHEKNIPFIEVKTVRNSQFMTSLGMPQFNDNHYFVYVESVFDDLYLFNFFNKLDINDQNLTMDSIYLKDNSKNIIQMPNSNLSEKIATLRLLGTYKGSDLIKHNLSFSINEPIRYIKDLRSIEEVDIPPKSKGMKTMINDDVFIYDPANEKKNQFLPIYTKANCVQIIHSSKMLMTKLYIEVIDSCYLNQFKLDAGFYEIEFAVFKKKSQEVELFNHKCIYDQSNYVHDSYPTDCTDELINKLEEVYNQENV